MLFRSMVIYYYYFLQFLKTRLAYRGDFIAGMVANMLVAISGMLFVIFLIDGETIKYLKGWSRSEVLFIYGYSMIPISIFSSVSMNLYRFGDRYIVQGQFDRVLLRPLNSLCQVLFESFNIETLGSFAIGLWVILYTASEMSLSFTAIDYLWLVLSALSGGTILLSVFIVLASLSFHFEDRLGVSAPVYNLITFGRYPLPIFNAVIQFVLCWIVPFAFVAFFPATHFLERGEFGVYCYLSPLVACATLSVAGLAWKLGVSSYASTGS